MAKECTVIDRLARMAPTFFGVFSTKKVSRPTETEMIATKSVSKKLYLFNISHKINTYIDIK
ncbi:hypothetical protein WN55_00683 [Dufourea novaeangliae]|uniref:Uncharacterized protein n=1 Tax=Dufourea novaeangliae TaxID=178035 RepID=A0A154P031_DUFNO|nr:hypothetical protein WN55_00683 [Dufourea novaeangliae]